MAQGKGVKALLWTASWLAPIGFFQGAQEVYEPAQVERGRKDQGFVQDTMHWAGDQFSMVRAVREWMDNDSNGTLNQANTAPEGLAGRVIITDGLLAMSALSKVLLDNARKP